MRIAACLYGYVGSLTGKLGYISKDPVDPRIPHRTFQDCILSCNKNIDVFIHTWSVDKKDVLENLYTPITILAEPQDPFDKNQLQNYGLSRRQKHEVYRYHSFSKWNSVYKAIKLKRDYEISNSSKYDCVFVSRLDMIYMRSIEFAKFNTARFYITKDKPDIKFNGRGLGPNRYNDNAFFSNSGFIDGILDNYHNIYDYSHTVPSDRPLHCIDNQSIFYHFVHAITTDENIEVALEMGLNSDLHIARIIHTNCPDIYNSIVEKLKQ